MSLPAALTKALLMANLSHGDYLSLSPKVQFFVLFSILSIRTSFLRHSLIPEVLGEQRSMKKAQSCLTVAFKALRRLTSPLGMAGMVPGAHDTYRHP